MSEQAPMERIEEALGLFGKAGTLVFQADDVRLLRSIALEAVAIVGDPDRYDLHRDYLCSLIGEYLGAEGHDWSEWRDPYEAVGGEMWHERTCRRCGEYDFERVPEQGIATPGVRSLARAPIRSKVDVPDERRQERLDDLNPPPRTPEQSVATPDTAIWHTNNDWDER